MTAAQTSLRSGICAWVIPALPKVLSQLLLEKGTHPKPLWNQSSTSHWCFPRMDLGSSPLQVSPLWEWGADPTLSSGAGINPCHTQSCCPGSAKTPKSPIFCLSHISCSRSFHPLTYFAVQRNKHKERGKICLQNSKISFKQAKNLSPFIIPLQPVMQHFHPLKPLVFFSLISLFFFFRNFQMPEQPQFSCQDGCTETSFSGSSVLCTFCSLEHSHKKKIKN